LNLVRKVFLKGQSKDIFKQEVKNLKILALLVANNIREFLKAKIK
jgi:hypothetical protein